MAQKYWIAQSDSFWSDSSSWSFSSGGPGGTSFPTIGDTANFDSSGTGVCHLDQTAQISGLYLHDAVIMSSSALMIVDGTISMSGATVLNLDTPGSYFKVFECNASPCVVKSDCTVETLVLGNGYFVNGYEQRTDATIHLLKDLYGSSGFGTWDSSFDVPIKFDGSTRQYVYNTAGCIYPTIIIDKA